MTAPARTVSFEDLGRVDLSVGSTYLGGNRGSLADEPLDKILHCGNMGGFRVRGSIANDSVYLAALFTTFKDPDWPDHLDDRTGRFIYYGDNKTPGHLLHETPKGGNELLRRCFDAIHVEPARRKIVPPFFVFANADPGRAVRFLGLAAPGHPGLSESEDLIAIWRTRRSERFQNYQASFTILDAEVVARAWVDSLVSGTPAHDLAPPAWRDWVERGAYRPRVR